MDVVLVHEPMQLIVLERGQVHLRIGRWYHRGGSSGGGLGVCRGVLCLGLGLRGRRPCTSTTHQEGLSGGAVPEHV